jgi:hypothetical protein
LKAEGELIFADGGKCANDRELAVVVDAKEELYSVICWLSAPEVGDKSIRPLALAAVRGQLRRDLLEAIPKLDGDTVNMLRRELWWHDYTVHANAADLRPQLAIQNFELATESEPEAISWILQQAEFTDCCLYQLIRSQNLPSEPELRAMLAQRGMFEPKLPWFDRNSQPAQACSTGLTKTSGGGLGGGGLGVGQSESPASLTKFCV